MGLPENDPFGRWLVEILANKIQEGVIVLPSEITLADETQAARHNVLRERLRAEDRVGPARLLFERPVRLSEEPFPRSMPTANAEGYEGCTQGWHRKGLEERFSDSPKPAGLAVGALRDICGDRAEKRALCADWTVSRLTRRC